ncbi:UNKNOWN [Stylonychia lemnae]|uniref:Uncharacterized protein n=1 Tax=Stylonychia lemnae TaxID=5949 RepID=A0A078AYE1_STYLE|nr:UNKNOWN [Stylonychia lemnae]|eukprot:CDW87425.1 UNKNOWN [Stylonychia lemnae]
MIILPVRSQMSSPQNQEQNQSYQIAFLGKEAKCNNKFLIKQLQKNAIKGMNSQQTNANEILEPLIDNDQEQGTSKIYEVISNSHQPHCPICEPINFEEKIRPIYEIEIK